MAAGTLLLPLFPGKAWTISTNVSVDSKYTKKSMFSVDIQKRSASHHSPIFFILPLTIWLYAVFLYSSLNFVYHGSGGNHGLNLTLRLPSADFFFYILLWIAYIILWCLLPSNSSDFFFQSPTVVYYNSKDQHAFCNEIAVLHETRILLMILTQINWFRILWRKKSFLKI